MNTLVKKALEKLIPDDVFRTELSAMIDEVNRAATDPDMVSRETEPEVEAIAETVEVTEAEIEANIEVERAFPPSDAPPTAAPAAAPAPQALVSPEMKAEILADKAFIGQLLAALAEVQNAQTAEQPAPAQTPEQRASEEALALEKETLTRTVKELSETVKEHDAVLTTLAELSVVEEAELPRVIRARTAVLAAPAPDKPMSLSERSANVLTRKAAKVVVKSKPKE